MKPFEILDVKQKGEETKIDVVLLASDEEEEEYQLESNPVATLFFKKSEQTPVIKIQDRGMIRSDILLSAEEKGSILLFLQQKEIQI